jgi:indole-3-glycerol phosphate synthase
VQGNALWRPPSGTLGRLTTRARARAAALESRRNELFARGREAPAAPSLIAALRRSTVTIIAEVKRKSPSKGAINPGLSADAQARAYEAGGAAAISVLTEPDEFGGSNDDLIAVRAATSVPVLKKDFHVEDVQLFEARAIGASAALLIARALPPSELERLAAVAAEIGLEVIVEIRDEEELDRAVARPVTLIGVNNRDLETLIIDPTTTERVLPRIPADRVAIAESGMSVRADIERAARAGADAVLIGSSLSAAADPVGALRDLGGVATSRSVRER